MSELAEKIFGTGAVDRPGDQPDRRDFRHEEIAQAFTPAVWKEKKPSEFFSVPPTNQGIAFDCVAHKYAKQMAIDNMNLNGGIYRHLSARAIYPYGYVEGGGMNNHYASSIVLKQGATLETLFPSENIPEMLARSAEGYAPDAKQIAFLFKPDSVIFCNPDFETIASILHSYQLAGEKKAVGILIVGENNGTWRSQFPTPPKTMDQPNLWYHGLVVTDFGLIGGKKYLATVNSWGEIGEKGVQFIGESYQPFIYGADYTTKLAYGAQGHAPNPPKYTWHSNLDIGSRGEDVLQMQIALQSMGFFPINSIQKPTGYFGGITRNALKTFQSSLLVPVTGIFDEPTREKFNEIFSGQ